MLTCLSLRKCVLARSAAIVTTMLVAAASVIAQGNNYKVTILVSDSASIGPPQVVDPNLKNPWGMSFSATSPFWVSNQRTGTSTLYSGDHLQPDGTRSPITKLGLTVTIPPAPGRPQGSPTGQVFNGSNDFVLGNGHPASFIFAALDGTISGWNGGTTAAIVASSPGAIYTGLAIGSNGTGNFLYAANVAAGTIDVYDGKFMPATLSGSFNDPDLCDNFAPYNIQNLNGELYVAYESRMDREHDGVVDVFDTDGNFSRRIAAGDPLNAPWGLALAPDSFGAFGGALLVGNFGLNDGRILAFDPITGELLGNLLDENGADIALERLWALAFGNGGSAGDPDVLYFAAGINNQQDGAFGHIIPIN